MISGRFRLGQKRVNIIICGPGTGNGEIDRENIFWIGTGQGLVIAERRVTSGSPTEFVPPVKAVPSPIYFSCQIAGRVLR
jgi:hypothetical protein